MTPEQRERVLATGSFMAAQLHDFGCRSAAVHKLRHRAQSGSRRLLVHHQEADDIKV